MGGPDNQSVVLPFSVVFDVKKIEEFSPDECSVDMKMQMIVRIKVTGIVDKEREEILDHIKNKLKMRINEEEMFLLNEGEKEDIGHHYTMTKSYDAKDNDPPDII